jgi:hypothetical protein
MSKTPRTDGLVDAIKQYDDGYDQDLEDMIDLAYDLEKENMDLQLALDAALAEIAALK